MSADKKYNQDIENTVGSTDSSSNKQTGKLRTETYSDTNRYNLYHSLMELYEKDYLGEYEFDEYELHYILTLIKKDLEIK